MKLKLPIKKSKEDIEFYKQNGPKFGKTLDYLYGCIEKRYVSRHKEIEELFHDCCKARFSGKDEVSFPFCSVKNYLDEEFGHSVCVSSNDCVAHGKEKTGNIISIDCGVTLNERNLVFDSAFTVDLNQTKQPWVTAPQEALVRVVEVFNSINGPKTTNTISEVIQEYAREKGLQVVVSMTGHGIGHTLHEYPYIANAVAEKHVPADLFDGLVICIEPVFVLPKEGDCSLIAKTYLDSDGWSIRTISGQPGSHFESMFVIEKNKLVDIVGVTNWFR